MLAKCFSFIFPHNHENAFSTVCNFFTQKCADIVKENGFSLKNLPYSKFKKTVLLYLSPKKQISEDKRNSKTPKKSKVVLQQIFPLGRVSHRVNRSVSLSVCLMSIPDVFFSSRPLIHWPSDHISAPPPSPTRGPGLWTRLVDPNRGHDFFTRLLEP